VPGLKGKQGHAALRSGLLAEAADAKVNTAKPLVEADQASLVQARSKPGASPEQARSKPGASPEAPTLTLPTGIVLLEKEHQWPGLKAIGKPAGEGERAENTTTEMGNGVLSALPALTPAPFNEVARQQWDVGNTSTGGSACR
jgi:hypothetical protein